MKISFPYEEKPSLVFGKILRPVVKAKIWSPPFKNWLEYTFIVDTGADYTIMPKSFSFDFGINLETNCTKYSSKGIGGTEVVYFFEKGLRFTIGKWARLVPVGFLTKDDIPPLLGRKACLDNLDICFKDLETIITTN